jgi:hydroxymethylglutaryl-CoA lyase
VTKPGQIQLVECPRDAMQGWPVLLTTQQKLHYIHQLLQVGFHTLDCLSFVSPKAIPQMADSHEVARQINLSGTHTKVLAIVANEKGARDAVQYDTIQVLGYPFGISPTFQLRNANSTIAESWERLMRIQSLCTAHSKELVVYLSMGFGNPYGDAFDETLVMHWVDQIKQSGIQTISLADTVGLATPEAVYAITKAAINTHPDVTIGVHLHSTPQNVKAKMDAAFRAGCSRFDGALKGVGGCPMANDDLVGNMKTEDMITYLMQKRPDFSVNDAALAKALDMAAALFEP